jgi:hypothetical protein
MKKILIISIALLLVSVWAVPAMAVDWSANGWIGIGFLYYKNIPNGVGSPVNLAGGISFLGSPTLGGSWHDDWNDENAYVQMRGHLQLTARASEDLYGVFHFEMDSTTWGEAGAGRNSMGAWGTDQVAVEVKNVFIDFRVSPNLPVWLRVGIQPYVVRPGWFLYRDGAGISGRVMIDPIKLMIRPFWGKETEGSIWRSDDRDIYGFDASLPIGPVTVGGFFIYENDREVGGSVFAPAVSDPCAVWWLGAYADAKIGPVKVTVDFAYDQGEWDLPMPNTDADFQGWGIRGVADATFGIFNVGIGGLYYSGGDTREVNAPASRDYGWFIRPGGSETTGTLDDSVIFGGWGSWYGPGIGHPSPPGWQSVWTTSLIWYSPNLAYDPSMSGMWGVRVFGSVQPLDWLKVMAQVAYWGDTTENGDTYGSSRDLTWWADNDEIGWEFDISTQVQIYKNLILKTAFGYLIAGSALDQWTPLVGNEIPQDPWAWYTSLIYAF